MNSYQPFYASQGILPPQQILQANGKSSIDNLRMSSNSSVLIADQTAPIVWKCVSDSLGNVTAEAFDITPHKDEAQIAQDNLIAVLGSINDRLKKLEDNYESIIERSSKPKYDANKANVANNKGSKKPTGHVITDDTE